MSKIVFLQICVFSCYITAMTIGRATSGTSIASHRDLIYEQENEIIALRKEALDLLLDILERNGSVSTNPKASPPLISPSDGFQIIRPTTTTERDIVADFGPDEGQTEESDVKQEVSSTELPAAVEKREEGDCDAPGKLRIDTLFGVPDDAPDQFITQWDEFDNPFVGTFVKNGESVYFGCPEGLSLANTILTTCTNGTLSRYHPECFDCSNCD